MRQEINSISKQNMSSEQAENFVRYLNPMDINVPPGYTVEVNV